MTQVSLRGLSKIYPSASGAAISDLSLDVNSGELIVLLGPSGCGKTTALRLIAGLLAPTAGDISFDGRSILRDRAEDRGAVMVFQSGLLFPFMSVAENIGFGLKMRKLPESQITERVADMLVRVKLPGFGPRKPSDLSGGQQQRVALARALIVQPRVLLLDEPLSNLDAYLRGDMRDLISNLHRDLGITTILVTHDQQEAVILGDRIALILDGRLRQYAAPETFYNRPADAAVARFLGGTNFLDGTSDGDHFNCGIGLLRLPSDSAVGPGILTIRPEAVRIGAGPTNNLTGTVTQTRLTLDCGGQMLEVISSPHMMDGIAVGQTMPITLPPAALWVMTGRN